MSTTETEDTSFKTVFLIKKLKEANLTIALPSAEDYVTYLHAALATHDLWLQVHLPCIKAVSPAFSISQTTSSRRNSTKRLLVTEPCTISWMTIGRIDHCVSQTKGLD
ncbi:hypothetical protein BDR04DRAFT_1095763 [Suillus decipiens]|nr:hypothetical protein BDR04DRAFT_1095763 [Suillus decipiens]